MTSTKVGTGEKSCLLATASAFILIDNLWKEGNFMPLGGLTGNPQEDNYYTPCTKFDDRHHGI